MPPRNPASLDALVRLLADEDRNVARVARARLLSSGRAAEGALERAAAGDDARLRARARALLSTIRLEILVRELRALAARPESAIDLEEGAFALARFVLPGSRRESCAPLLAGWGEALRDRVGGSRDAGRIAEEAGALLGGELGFRGNEERYYDPVNSCVNWVLERRRGIPITLSLVYLFVARRAGLPVFPVALPTHFLVRCGPSESGVLLDPFRGGRRVRPEDCASLLASRGITFHPSHLLEPTPRMVLVRMAGNLVVAYERQRNRRTAREAARLRLALLASSRTRRRNS